MRNVWWTFIAIIVVLLAVIFIKIYVTSIQAPCNIVTGIFRAVKLRIVCMWSRAVVWRWCWGLANLG